MLWRLGRYRDKGRLAQALAESRGKIPGALRRELLRLGAVELARFLADLWPQLERATRQQLTALAEEEGIIGAWLEVLEEGKPFEKTAAAAVLGEMEVKAAIGPLLAALGDGDGGVQMAVTAALIRLGDARCLGPLLVALKEPRRWPPARVAEILLAFKQESLPLLLELLERETDEEMTVRLINILATFKEGQSLTALTRFLDDEREDVRRAAASALGEIGCFTGARALVKALKDPSAGVRAAAALALGKLKSREALSSLKECLADKSWEVRTAAAAALGEIGTAGEAHPTKGE
ncbi:MAG: HEAT repeat domain-containing protein [Moorella humiferrea]|nr:HEAT repeat domain-containing protein [Moorella humiferrea]